MKRKVISIKSLKISQLLLVLVLSCFINSCQKSDSKSNADTVNQTSSNGNILKDNNSDSNENNSDSIDNKTDSNDNKTDSDENKADSNDNKTDSYTNSSPTIIAPADNIPMELTKDLDYLIRIDGTDTYQISDLLYGLFLEDINFAIDGGLYAEMVKNRSFEYASMAKEEGFHGFSTIGDVSYEILDGSKDNSFLNRNNPHYLRLKNKSGEFRGIKNSGFLDGMNIEANTSYDFSVYARTDTPTKICVQLKNETGTVYAESTVEISKKEWWKYATTLTTTDETPKNATLHVLITKGTIDVDMISLFPVDTYKNRQNGLRKDLASALEDLTPKFLRFPGGCVVEGESLQNAYNWKDSIGNGLEFTINGEVSYGDVAARPVAENIWGNQHSKSDHPYYMTYGVGFYEYFLLSEDLNCEPIPIVNAGLSCQIQGTKTVGKAYEELDINSIEFKQYIKDALDLVEFCKGDATTKWGSIRIAMGHEKPFPLNFIGIGNEQWGNSYFLRYEAFKEAFAEAAIKNPDLYSGIQLIVANGPTANDKHAWNKIKLYGADYAALVDEHFYMTPSWFLINTNRYDSYDRSNTPVFLGEYAAKSNTMEAALSEAAFMTGLERNGDIVSLASYAPLFGNSVSYQWAPDLIWFKSKQTWNSANYYVQKIFSNNKGTHVVPSNISIRTNESNTTKEMLNTNFQVQNELYQVVSIDENYDLIIKIVNVSGGPKNIVFELNNLTISSSTAIISTITSDTLKDINTIAQPDKINIKEETYTLNYLSPNLISYTVPKYSVVVIRIPLYK